eukprot:COSAG01_NODE_65454_length_273_cov_0.597701_1_plen_79_part_01
MYHLEARGEVKIDRTVFDRLSSRQKITVRLLPSLPCLCPGAVCQLRFLGILTHAVLLQYGTELQVAQFHTLADAYSKMY